MSLVESFMTSTKGKRKSQQWSVLVNNTSQLGENNNENNNYNNSDNNDNNLIINNKNDK